MINRYNKNLFWGIVALLVLTFFAYSPVMKAGFIWDDDLLIINNELLRTFDGLKTIWTGIDLQVQYYPLTLTTFWIEYNTWQLNPMGFHLINVALHAINALILWFILKRLQIPGAWFAAAVFALHPVHVESVAWITQRKNVLSSFFYLLSLLTYIKFFRQEE